MKEKEDFSCLALARSLAGARAARAGTKKRIFVHAVEISIVD